MYLGIDLGTSSMKLVLLDEQQTIIAQHAETLSVSTPKPLWSEQHPHDWWQALCRGIQALRVSHQQSLRALKAIGLSGQQHGATLLDAKHEVLRPAMLWNDGRAHEECGELEASIAQAAHITGSRMMAGFTAPKLLWVAKHEPDIFKRVAKVLLPKDYLRLMITGEYATDVSDAAGTGWLNTAERRWSDEMLAATHLNQTHMPALFEGSHVTGKVSPSIAAQWGIPAETMVAGGGGDNPASAMSLNVIKPGSAFLSLGTSGVYFVASDRYQTNPAGGIHTFCHCLPERWHHMSVHLSSASCLAWLATTMQCQPSTLLQEAESQFRIDNPVIFLPYLSGERTPHINPHAKGVFFGMTHATTRADLTNAVLEGVAFAFADGQQAMQEAGIHIDTVSVVGGGAQSLYWGKLLAAILQRPLIYRANREIGAALGAARLAWLSQHDCDPQTAFAESPIETIIQPDTALAAHYLQKRETFKLLYQRLHDLFI